jgi:23S rRNA (uracil-5-)-methyltransferase RumA
MPIASSPNEKGYRNKMEFSFGDEEKGGELALGMRKRDSFYEVVNVANCQIVDSDYQMILTTVKDYFKAKGATFYHKNKHEGMLRHLVVRKSAKTGQILINLITSSQITVDISDFVATLCGLQLKGSIVGILHTINDSIADIVKADELRVLYGQDYFMEELLGLKFKVSVFSFFQTNSLGAERLYSIAREFVGETNDKVLFDLYCGTGTIAQIMSPTCKKVIGIELVEEAVEAAKENAKLNGITNCEFIAGDVLKKIDELDVKPDIIILDPPREGIHPKAIGKIIDFGAEKLIYVSCKPTSLARDLEVFEANGYKVEKVKCMDMFPGTVHVETVVL